MDIHKEIKKYKAFIIISILGLILSVGCIIYFFINNDSRLWGFGAIALADIYELQREIKRYTAAKEELSLNPHTDQNH